VRKRREEEKEKRERKGDTRGLKREERKVLYGEI
jgi:hypothetical protein